MEIVRERMWNVGMKLSISNIAWKKEHDKEMYQVCRDMGYHGIEIAPSRIFGKYPYKNMKEAYEYRDELKKLYHLEVSSVQSIWYGKQGFLFKEDYDLFVDYTYQVIRFASQLGAGNIVFGSPEIRRIFQPEDYQKGMKFFVNISRYAEKYNTVFSIEANPAVYGTNYINETLEAVDIVKRIGSEHLKVNLDIGTIICNDEAKKLRNRLLSEIEIYSGIEIICNARIKSIEADDKEYLIIMENGSIYRSSFVLNATYASVNQINTRLGYEPFNIKYELCEIILCSVSDELKNVGLTVMDGPFFSIMPFGKTGNHSLTSVTFTPHLTSYDAMPSFPCQKMCETGYCSPKQFGNCDECIAKPATAWDYMSKLAQKYMKDELAFSYKRSLFSMKPILKNSEIDDSRPTVLKELSVNPNFVSVLSGKINTVYDLDEVLLNEK